MTRASHGGLPRILFVGGEFERKGGTLLLEATQGLDDRCEVWIVTKSAVPQRPGVHVVDDLTPNDPRLIELYRSAAMFVLPSRAETFGIAALEASSVGLPVIASRVGGLADIAVDGQTGLTIPVGDAGALRQAITRLLDDESLRSRMGAAARDRAVEHYDSIRNAARLLPRGDRRGERGTIMTVPGWARPEPPDPTGQPWGAPTVLPAPSAQPGPPSQPAPGDDRDGEPDAIDTVAGASVSRNLLHLMSSQLVTWTLTTLLMIMQPRFLGDTAMGQLRLAFSLWAIAQVFIGLGTSYYLTLEIARDRRRGMAMLVPIVMLRTIMWGIASITLGVFAALTETDVEFTGIMVLFGVMVLFITVSESIGAAFAGLELMSVPAIASIIARVIGTVASVIVLLAGGGPRAVMSVAVCTTFLGLVLLVRAIRPYITLETAGWWHTGSRAAKASSGFLAAAAILVVYQQIDTVVISLLVDREVLGWYGTADVLFGSLLFVPTIVTASIFPVLGRLHQDDQSQLIDLVGRTFRSLLLLGVPIGLGTMVVARNVAPLLFGEEFRPTGQVLFTLGPVIVLTFGTVLFGTVALATGRQAFWNLVMAAGALMTVPLDLVFVPWADRRYANGAIGGAMAYVVTESMMIVLGLWKVVPYLLGRTTVAQVGRVLVAGGLMFAASWPLRDQFILLPVVVAAAVYVGAALLLGAITEEERRMVSRLALTIALHSGADRSHRTPPAGEPLSSTPATPATSAARPNRWTRCTSGGTNTAAYDVAYGGAHQCLYSAPPPMSKMSYPACLAHSNDTSSTRVPTRCFSNARSRPVHSNFTTPSAQKCTQPATGWPSLASITECTRSPCRCPHTARRSGADATSPVSLSRQ